MSDQHDVQVTRNLVIGAVACLMVVIGGLVGCEVVDAQRPPEPPKPEVITIEGHVCTKIRKENPQGAGNYDTYECNK